MESSASLTRHQIYYRNNKERRNNVSHIYYQNNKERILEQQKQYREENKEDINAKRSEKIICECGKSVTKRHKARHEQSEYHQQNCKK